MNQEVEIELKNLVNKQEFEQIMLHFGLTLASFVEQTNYYFDTTDFRLKELGCALRIRQKKNQYTFTLKQPHGEALLETHELLNEQTAHKFISGKLNEKSDMMNLLQHKLNIEPSSLRSLGSLTTCRAEINYQSGLLVFDHSMYLHHEDFEIEFEVKDAAQGKYEFEQFLQKFNIPKRKTPNKIRRFFDVKKSLR
ncbi:CYTH domain-containing protein [Alkalihalobacillus sp. AL-G]|uniref:CYTH domain-containing protein n=1 Tax=Alkalihalobacillus sp. AL-G TaxID=2926399 RepID=UPI00272C8E66|nr:CYTH domain-containing protein [Alkalihalobacillus sp. AL-G]WLD94926.1 CYTH domain-containing protein [Alkalihalobacillus sp. AL-G]